VGVGKAGSSGLSSEDVQNIRSGYEMREAQKERAHGDQIKDIKAKHEIDLNRVTAESKEDVDKVRTNSQAKMTELEQKYQKDIDNLKAMYQRKLGERET
jgi:predicted secreted Zn-dependent protease